MSNEIDIVGTENVAEMIKNSNLPRFVIHRKGAHAGATPVYECLHTKNSVEASNDFRGWSKIILQGNPFNNSIYDIVCFREKGEDEEGSSSGNIKRERSGRTRMSFILTNPFGNNQGMGTVNAPPPNYNQQQGMSEERVAKMIADAVKQDRLERENDNLKQQLKDLQEEMDEEEDDPNDLGHPLLNVLLENLKDNPKFFGKKPDKKTTTEKEEKREEEPAAVNGTTMTDDAKKQMMQRVALVLARLKKADTKIIDHLEKLADVAEKKPATFAMMLEQLDSM